MSFFLSSNAKRQKKKKVLFLPIRERKFFKAVSCKAVSCVINLVELLGPVGPMRWPSGWISWDPANVRSRKLPIWVHLDCHLGFMGLPFGVHGTAVWGPCDRHLGSVGLPIRVHGTAIGIQCDCHMKAIVRQFCGSQGSLCVYNCTCQTGPSVGCGQPESNSEGLLFPDWDQFHKCMILSPNDVWISFRAQTTVSRIYTSSMSILVKRGYRTLEVDDPWLDAGFICLEQWHL